MSVRLACGLLAIACAGGAFAQAGNSWTSAQWAPLTDENDKLYQQAHADYDAAVAQARQRAEEAARAGPRRSRMELEEENDPAKVPRSATERAAGGPTDALGPGDTLPGRGKKAEWMKFEQLLPASLDFAAPRNAGLILQRTSTSVVFGRTDSDEIVMLPLSGADTDIVHGMRASLSQANGDLRMLVGLPTGSSVLYEYHQDPATHVLSVNIRVGGGPPGTGVELKRLYRPAQAPASAPQKSAQ